MDDYKELSIFIADDHAMVVDGLKEILKAKKKWVVRGIAHDGEELIGLMKEDQADVVVLDINMPRLNGIECTRWIKANMPSTKVIVLTMYPEKTYLSELLKAGADGCLLKSRGSMDLLEAIARVTNGKSYFDWIGEFRSDDGAWEYKLSDREREIIKLIVQGRSSLAIADELFISEDTVRTHRKNIFKKLKIHHITELMTFALNNGLS